MVPMLGFAFAAMITLAAQTSATAADRIQLAVQRTGTLAWELDVIRAHGLDRKFDLAIETIELAAILPAPVEASSRVSMARTNLRSRPCPLMTSSSHASVPVLCTANRMRSAAVALV